MATAQTPISTPAAPRTAIGIGELRRLLDRHVAEARSAGLTDDQIRRSLVAADWRATDVDLALSRARNHKGSFGYTWLFFSLGFAGLSLAGASHVFLDGLKDDTSRTALVGWLTILFCTTPFAVAALRWANDAERKDPSIRDNPLRRTLGMTLLWICGIVGMARLFEFVARFFSVVVKPGDNPAADPMASFAQVVVTVAIAGGIFWWTWDLLHRGESTDG
jgi:hypothetical protein